MAPYPLTHPQPPLHPRIQVLPRSPAEGSAVQQQAQHDVCADDVDTCSSLILTPAPSLTWTLTPITPTPKPDLALSLTQPLPRPGGHVPALQEAGRSEVRGGRHGA